jgi:hypothetical protein
MSCGAGCADCPTCRGEVLPDSPVMKDMAFAMAMARGPMYEDKFLGPLSVSQTVRDGARRRGGLSAADQSVLTHLQSANERSGPSGPVLMAGIWLPPPHGPILPPSHGREDEANRQRALARQRSVTVETGTKLRLLVPTLVHEEPREYRRRKRPRPGTECCVREFWFPQDVSAFFGPSSETDTVVVGGFHFTVKAVFDSEKTQDRDDSRTCDCSCCEYEQYVTHLVNDMNAVDKTKPNHRDLIEDCVWWYREDEDAHGVVPLEKQEKASDELPPTRGDGNPSSDVETLCYGDKPDLYAKPKGMKTSGGYVSECFYETCDEPRRPLDKRSERVFAWLFMGQIVDVCNNRAVLARDWLYLKMEKKAGASEVPSFKVGLGGPADQAAILGVERVKGDESECP